MTFNELRKEIEKRIPDKNLAYVLTLLGDMILAQGKDLDQMSSIMLNFAEQLQKFSSINGLFKAEMDQIKKRHAVDGVVVESVVNAPTE